MHCRASICCGILWTGRFPQRCFKTFLRELDPMKVYFYQSDVDEFAKSRDVLAAEASDNGDISFAYRVFDRLLARVDERVKMIDQLLKTPQDFTLDEEMVKDKDLATYAKTEAEARDRWRKRIKYDLLLLKADSADPKAAKKDPFEGKTPQERLTQRYHSFAKRLHQTSSDELLEMYLTVADHVAWIRTPTTCRPARWRTSRS